MSKMIFNQNYYRELGGRDQDIYADNAWLMNRIFIDSGNCKDFAEFHAKAEIALTAYYTRRQAVTGDVMRTSAPPLATSPTFLVEAIRQKSFNTAETVIYRLWINATIRSEAEYDTALSAAVMQKSRMQELVDRYGYTLAKLQPGFNTHAPKYCSLKAEG